MSPVPDLLLHLPGLSWIPAEHEESRREPVEPVDRPQVLQVVLLGQDEDNGVVPVAAAGVHLQDHSHGAATAALRRSLARVTPGC